MASAPSMSAYSQDLCLVGISGGISTIGFGVSAGTYKTDENCERIKLSKVLSDLGMKVASVSILCQDPRVFFAMEQSGTPCPFEGKIGKAASEQWKKYDKLRPDYAQYTDRLRVVEKAEDEYEQKLKLKEWKDKLDAAEKIRNGDVDVDKTFNQSKRVENYNFKIEKLKNDGRLYPCFESSEELSLKKKSLLWVLIILSQLLKLARTLLTTNGIHY